MKRNFRIMVGTMAVALGICAAPLFGAKAYAAEENDQAYDYTVQAEQDGEPVQDVTQGDSLVQEDLQNGGNDGETPDAAQIEDEQTVDTVQDDSSVQETIQAPVPLINTEGVAENGVADVNADADASGKATAASGANTGVDAKTDASTADKAAATDAGTDKKEEAKPAAPSYAILKASYATIFNGVDYAPVYNYNYYVDRYKDIWNAFKLDDTATLRHFIVYGIKEGRQGSDSFELASYKNAYVDLRTAFGNDNESYYKHYLNYGKKEGRKSVGVNKRVGSVTKLAGKDYSAVYNFDEYQKKYGDIKNAFKDDDVKTLTHFVNYGMKEGRQAKSSFNVGSYANEYQDLRNAFKNDLPKYYQHYMNYGSKEGRKATGTAKLKNPVTVYQGLNYSPVYNYEYYTAKHPDIKKQYGYDDAGVLAYFMTKGLPKYEMGNDSFDVRSYMNAYADLRRAFKQDTAKYAKHYVQYGKKEGRVTKGVTELRGATTVYGGVDYSAVYDYNFYQKKYGDIKNAFGYDDEATLKHFINYGMKEGRQGNSNFELKSYAYKYSDLRHAFKDNFKGYYMHYVNYGKKEGRKATGVKEMQDYATKYSDVDYVTVYDFNYYWKNNAKVRSITTFDDEAAIKYFAENDIYNSTKAISWVGDINDYVTMKEELAMSSKNETRNAVVNYAMTFLGYRYVYGGSTPEGGFDCSGFTSYVYKKFGYSLHRTARDQQKDGIEVYELRDALPGDIICRPTGSSYATGHVGIYIGNGQMIHAANERDGVKIGAAETSDRPIIAIRRIIY